MRIYCNCILHGQNEIHNCTNEILCQCCQCEPTCILEHQ